MPALDAGADDFVTKPFEAAELASTAAGDSTARPCRVPRMRHFEAGHLVIDFNSRSVTVGGREIKLTATEYALLRLLALHAGKVVTQKQLLREVWGPNAEEQSQYLRVYMMHLRKKIEISEGPDRLLKNGKRDRISSGDSTAQASGLKIPGRQR